MGKAINQAYESYRAKLNKICNPFNIRKGWNLIMFSGDDSDIDLNAKYNDNPQIQLKNCCYIYMQDLVGLHQPNRTDKLNLPPRLWERIGYMVKKQYKEDVPYWICICIYRKDNITQKQKEELDKRGIRLKKGRIQYLIGIIEQLEFDKLLAEIKRKQDWNKLEKYLDNGD